MPEQKKNKKPTYTKRIKNLITHKTTKHEAKHNFCNNEKTPETDNLINLQSESFTRINEIEGKKMYSDTGYLKEQNQIETENECMDDKSVGCDCPLIDITTMPMNNNYTVNFIQSKSENAKSKANNKSLSSYTTRKAKNNSNKAIETSPKDIRKCKASCKLTKAPFVSTVRSQAIYNVKSKYNMVTAARKKRHNSIKEKISPETEGTKMETKNSENSVNETHCETSFETHKSISYVLLAQDLSLPNKNESDVKEIKKASFDKNKENEYEINYIDSEMRNKSVNDNDILCNIKNESSKHTSHKKDSEIINVSKTRNCYKIKEQHNPDGEKMEKKHVLSKEKSSIGQVVPSESQNKTKEQRSLYGEKIIRKKRVLRKKCIVGQVGSRGSQNKMNEYYNVKKNYEMTDVSETDKNKEHSPKGEKIKKKRVGSQNEYSNEEKEEHSPDGEKIKKKRELSVKKSGVEQLGSRGSQNEYSNVKLDDEMTDVSKTHLYNKNKEQHSPDGEKLRKKHTVSKENSTVEHLESRRRRNESNERTDVKKNEITNVSKSHLYYKNKERHSPDGEKLKKKHTVSKENSTVEHHEFRRSQNESNEHTDIKKDKITNVSKAHSYNKIKVHSSDGGKKGKHKRVVSRYKSCVEEVGCRGSQNELTIDIEDVQENSSTSVDSNKTTIWPEKTKTDVFSVIRNDKCFESELSENSSEIEFQSSQEKICVSNPRHNKNLRKHENSCKHKKQKRNNKNTYKSAVSDEKLVNHNDSSVGSESSQFKKKKRLSSKNECDSIDEPSCSKKNDPKLKTREEEKHCSENNELEGNQSKSYNSRNNPSTIKNKRNRKNDKAQNGRFTQNRLNSRHNYRYNGTKLHGKQKDIVNVRCYSEGRGKNFSNLNKHSSGANYKLGAGNKNSEESRVDITMCGLNMCRKIVKFNKSENKQPMKNNEDEYLVNDWFQNIDIKKIKEGDDTPIGHIYKINVPVVYDIIFRDPNTIMNYNLQKKNTSVKAIQPFKKGNGIPYPDSNPTYRISHMQVKKQQKVFRDAQISIYNKYLKGFVNNNDSNESIPKIHKRNSFEENDYPDMYSLESFEEEIKPDSSNRYLKNILDQGKLKHVNNSEKIDADQARYDRNKYTSNTCNMGQTIIDSSNSLTDEICVKKEMHYGDILRMKLNQPKEPAYSRKKAMENVYNRVNMNYHRKFLTDRYSDENISAHKKQIPMYIHENTNTLPTASQQSTGTNKHERDEKLKPAEISSDTVLNTNIIKIDDKHKKNTTEGTNKIMLTIKNDNITRLVTGVEKATSSKTVLVFSNAEKNCSDEDLCFRGLRFHKTQLSSNSVSEKQKKGLLSKLKQLF